MTVIRLLSTALALVMAAAIVWAAIDGDFSADGEQILGLPWGVVSIIDVYVGAALVATWIWWRDGPSQGLVWLLLLVVLGHLATALYVAWRSWTVESVPSLLAGSRAGVDSPA